MKKYYSPEISVMEMTVVDVLNASTGGYNNENDNIANWGDAQ